MENTELLRFTTAGSVDDGKSTLIGRLLYDSKSIFEDQYELIKATSEKRNPKLIATLLINIILIMLSINQHYQMSH